MQTPSLTIPSLSFSVHWIIYPLLAVGLVGATWVYRDSQVKDAASQKQVQVAQQTQARTDKQAETSITQAATELKQKNATLTQARVAAKTPQQQVDLVNKEEGTHLSIQAQNPSSTTVGSDILVKASQLDAGKITDTIVDFQKCQNQMAADAIDLTAKDQQLAARDATIKSQNEEITALKGGSKWHRILRATEFVVIAGGTGYAVGRLSK